MRAVRLALALAVLVPAAARADSIPVSVYSSGSGFSQIGTTVAAGALDLGTIAMPNVNAFGNLLITGYRTNTDFLVSFMVEGLGAFDTLKFEVFNPAGSNNRSDPEQPSYVPAGFSTSNAYDALSFAQDSGLTRSAVFAGGSGTVFADEITNRGDLLWFSGLAGAETARITFALRDGLTFAQGKGGGFLLRISAADPVSAPEPASMILLGTGLAGVIAARRRRAAAR